MRKLSAFTFISINGFYKGSGEDISWHRHGEEENRYAAESMESGNILLFGRKTYDLMVSYWPTPMAMKNDPSVAEGMNKSEKIVFSRTLKTADWNNTRIIGDRIVDEIRMLKQSEGQDLTILGSGSIVSLFTDHDLIDEYAIMVDPVILEQGTPIFSGIRRRSDLKLRNSRVFKSGVVLLNYQVR